MTLGEKLSQLRKKSNYTQEQLADILGVSRQSVSKWESDVAYPETDKLIRLSILFRCSLDYLVKEDIVEMSSQSCALQGKDLGFVNKFVKGMLRYAPAVVFSMWALLLWAFYAAPLIAETNDSLYIWFGSNIVYELQPIIRALISLGVIACAYVCPLLVAQRFGNKKFKFWTTVCSFLFEIAIFALALCLVGECKNCGFENGDVVLVLAISTGVMTLLQIGFIVLKWYYNKATGQGNCDAKANCVEKIKNWFKLHKLVAIVVACVLVVGITLGTVLPLTVGKFSVTTVSRIKYMSSNEMITRILGEPIYSSDELKDIVGGQLDDGDAAFYFSPKANKLIRNMLRAKEMSNTPQSLSDALLIYAKYNNLKKQLSGLEFQYIKIYLNYDLSSQAVEFNTAYTVHTAQKVKWNIRGKKNQMIKFIPKEISYGSTPSAWYALQAQIFYSDGSYKLSYLDNPDVQGGVNMGWTVTWSDHWGKYTKSIQQSKTPKAMDYGDVSKDVSYYVTSYYSSFDAQDMYKLYIFGNGEDGYGEMKNRDEYPWSKYADRVSEIHVANGITNIPDNAFKDFVNLRAVTLPSSVTTIGRNAFDGCSVIKLRMDLSTLQQIQPYAFVGCGFAFESMFLGLDDGSGNGIDWAVRLSSSDEWENITVDNRYTLLNYLTITYAAYYWSKR